MRKLIGLLLCLCLTLTLVPAPAETAFETDTRTYADPAGFYACRYPDGYTLIDREVIERMMDMYSGGDGGLSAMTGQYRDLILDANTVILFSADLAANISITTRDVGMALTPDSLLVMAAGIEEQLKTVIPGIRFISESRLAAFSDAMTALVLEFQYDLAGQSLSGVQACFCFGARMLCVTLTAPTDRIEDFYQDLMPVLTTIAPL